MQGRGNRRLSPVMMQSIVGLMILGTIGALIFLILWLKNIGFGGRSFRAEIQFPNASGMTTGTRVAYRGVRVGQVVSIDPQPEGVMIGVEISPANRLIPSNSIIEATQAGLVGETSIDITPLQALPPEDIAGKPLDANCDPSIIICNGSRLQGQGSLDINALIRSLVKISNLVSDPEVTSAIRSLAQKSSLALGNFNQLSGSATDVLRDVQQTGTVNQLNTSLRSLNRTAGEVGLLSNDARALINYFEQSGGLQNLNTTLADMRRLVNTLESSGGIENLNTTLSDARRALNAVETAANQIGTFMQANQEQLTITLKSIHQTSDQLRTTIARLDPILAETDTRQLIKNLESISQNTAELTGNLKEFSIYLNDPQTRLMIQQILDSARSAFDNAQKITSDLDEITGNPQFRQDLIRLIYGLTNLVSSTQQLEQQIYYGQVLNQMSVQIAPPQGKGESQPPATESKNSAKKEEKESK